jgi:hypothetical protein
LIVLVLCAVGFFTGCGQTFDPSPLPSNGASEAASAQSHRREWASLVEKTRGEKLSRIESDLPIGDAELAALTDLTHLREIVLPHAKASDKALDAVASLVGVEVLVFGDTTITDDGLAKLSRLQRLRDLNLNQSRITDRGLAYLVDLPRLQLLRIGKSDITDDGLALAGRIRTLRFLILQNAHITGRGFQYLHGLKKLESLYLAGNPLTGEGVAELRLALPGLHPDW